MNCLLRHSVYLAYIWQNCTDASRSTVAVTRNRNHNDDDDDDDVDDDDETEIINTLNRATSLSSLSFPFFNSSNAAVFSETLFSRASFSRCHFSSVAFACFRSVLTLSVSWYFSAISASFSRIISLNASVWFMVVEMSCTCNFSAVCFNSTCARQVAQRKKSTAVMMLFTTTKQSKPPTPVVEKLIYFIYGRKKIQKRWKRDKTKNVQRFLTFILDTKCRHGHNVICSLCAKHATDNMQKNS